LKLLLSVVEFSKAKDSNRCTAAIQVDEPDDSSGRKATNEPEQWTALNNLLIPNPTDAG
jgi:hypothetical protein